MNTKTAVCALGFASIGIGLAELFATRKIEECLGLDQGKYSGVVRVLGIREVAHGVDLLAHEKPRAGLWARAAGDVLDGTLLVAAAAKTKNNRRFSVTALLVSGIVAADAICLFKCH